MHDLFGEIPAKKKSVKDNAEKLAYLRLSMSEIAQEKAELAPEVDGYVAARRLAMDRIKSQLSREGRPNMAPTAKHIPLYDELVRLAVKHGPAMTRFKALAALVNGMGKEIEALTKADAKHRPGLKED